MAVTEAQKSDDLPVELASALEAAPEAKAVFEKLPPSHRQEYVRWVSEAKKVETRADRSQKAVAMILEKARK